MSSSVVSLLLPLFIVLLLFILTFVSAAVYEMDLSSAVGSFVLLENADHRNDDIIITGTFPEPVDEGFCLAVIYRVIAKSITVQTSATFNSYCQLNISEVTITNGFIDVFGSFQPNSQFNIENITMISNDPMRSMRPLVRYQPTGVNAPSLLSVAMSTFRRENLKYLTDSSSQPRITTCGGYEASTDPNNIKVYPTICIVPPVCNLQSDGDIQCPPDLDTEGLILFRHNTFIDEVAEHDDSGVSNLPSASDFASIAFRPNTPAVSQLTTASSCGMTCPVLDIYDNDFEQKVIVSSDASNFSPSRSSFQRTIFSTVNYVGVITSQLRLHANNVTQLNAGRGAKLLHFGDLNSGGTDRFGFPSGALVTSNIYIAEFENEVIKYLPLRASATSFDLLRTSIYSAIHAEFQTHTMTIIRNLRIDSNSFHLDGVSTQVFLTTTTAPTDFAQGAFGMTTQYFKGTLSFSHNFVNQTAMLPNTQANSEISLSDVSVLYQLPVCGVPETEIVSNTIILQVLVPLDVLCLNTFSSNFLSQLTSIKTSLLFMSTGSNAQNLNTDARIKMDSNRMWSGLNFIRSNGYATSSSSSTIDFDNFPIQNTQSVLLSMNGQLSNFDTITSNHNHLYLLENEDHQNPSYYAALLPPRKIQSRLLGAFYFGVGSGQTIQNTFYITQQYNAVNLPYYFPSSSSSSTTSSSLAYQQTHLYLTYSQKMVSYQLQPEYNTVRVVAHYNDSSSSSSSASFARNVNINQQPEISVGIVHQDSPATGAITYSSLQHNDVHVFDFPLSLMTPQAISESHGKTKLLFPIFELIIMNFMQNTNDDQSFYIDNGYYVNNTIMTCNQTDYRDYMRTGPPPFIPNSFYDPSVATVYFEISRLAVVYVPQTMTVGTVLYCFGNHLYLLENAVVVNASSSSSSSSSYLTSSPPVSVLILENDDSATRQASQINIESNFLRWYITTTYVTSDNNRFVAFFSSGILSCDSLNILQNSFTVDLYNNDILDFDDNTTTINLLSKSFDLAIFDNPQYFSSSTEITISQNFIRLRSQQRSPSSMNALILGRDLGTDEVSTVYIQSNAFHKTVDTDFHFLTTKRLSTHLGGTIAIQQNRIQSNITRDLFYYQHHQTSASSTSSALSHITSSSLFKRSSSIVAFETDGQQGSVTTIDSPFYLQQNTFSGYFITSNGNLMKEFRFSFANVSIATNQLVILNNNFTLTQTFYDQQQQQSSSLPSYQSLNFASIFEFTGSENTINSDVRLLGNLFEFSSSSSESSSNNNNHDMTPLIIRRFSLLQLHHFSKINIGGNDGMIDCRGNTFRFIVTTAAQPASTLFQIGTFSLASFVDNHLFVSSMVGEYLSCKENSIQDILVQDSAYMFENVKGQLNWLSSSSSPQFRYQDHHIVTFSENKLWISLSTSDLFFQHQEGSFVTLVAAADVYTRNPLAIQNNILRVNSSLVSIFPASMMPITISSLCFGCGRNYADSSSPLSTIPLNLKCGSSSSLSTSSGSAVTTPCTWNISNNELYSVGRSEKGFLDPSLGSFSQETLWKTTVTLISSIFKTNPSSSRFYSRLELAALNLTLDGNHLVYPTGNGEQNSKFVMQSTSFYSPLSFSFAEEGKLLPIDLREVSSSSSYLMSLNVNTWSNTGCNTVSWGVDASDPSITAHHTILTRFFYKLRFYSNSNSSSTTNPIIMNSEKAFIINNNVNYRNDEEIARCNSFSHSLTYSDSISTTSSLSESLSSSETSSVSESHSESDPSPTLSENFTESVTITPISLSRTATKTKSPSESQSETVTESVSLPTESLSISDNDTETRSWTISSSITATADNLSISASETATHTQSFSHSSTEPTPSVVPVGAELGLAASVQDALVTSTAAVSSFASIFAAFPLAAMAVSRGLAITELMACQSRPPGKSTRWIDEKPKFPWSLVPGVRIDPISGAAVDSSAYVSQNKKTTNKNENENDKNTQNDNVLVYDWEDRPGTAGYYRAAVIVFSSLFVFCVTFLGLGVTRILMPSKIQMMKMMNRVNNLGNNKKKNQKEQREGKKDKKHKHKTKHRHSISSSDDDSLEEALLTKNNLDKLAVSPAAASASASSPRGKVLSQKKKKIIDPETNQKKTLIIRRRRKQLHNNQKDVGNAAASSPKDSNKQDAKEKKKEPNTIPTDRSSSSAGKEKSSTRNNKVPLKPKLDTSSPENLWPFWTKIPDTLLLVIGAFLGYWCVSVGTLVSATISNPGHLLTSNNNAGTYDIVIGVAPLGILILIWFACLLKVRAAIQPKLPGTFWGHHESSLDENKKVMTVSSSASSNKKSDKRKLNLSEFSDKEQGVEEENTVIHDFTSCPCEYHLVPSYLMDAAEFDRIEGNAVKSDKKAKVLIGDEAKKQLGALRFLQSDVGRKLFVGNVTWTRRVEKLEQEEQQEEYQSRKKNKKKDKQKNKKENKKKHEKDVEHDSSYLPPTISSVSLLDYLTTYVSFFQGPLQTVTIFDEGKMNYSTSRQLTPYFVFIEIFVTILVCTLQGISLGMDNEETICRSTIWTAAVVNFLTFFLALWLRPFIMTYANIVLILVELCTFLASAGSLALIYLFSTDTVADNSTASTIATAVQLCLSVGPLLAFLLGICLTFTRWFLMRRARVVVVDAPTYWKRFDEQNQKHQNKNGTNYRNLVDGLLGENNNHHFVDEDEDDQQMLELICGGGVNSRVFPAVEAQSRGKKKKNTAASISGFEDDDESDDVDDLLDEDRYRQRVNKNQNTNAARYSNNAQNHDRGNKNDDHDDYDPYNVDVGFDNDEEEFEEEEEEEDDEEFFRNNKPNINSPSNRVAGTTSSMKPPTQIVTNDNSSLDEDDEDEEEEYEEEEEEEEEDLLEDDKKKNVVSADEKQLL